MTAFFLFIIGLSFGSFLLVVVDRSENGLPIATGRSRCDKCKKLLAWYDLVPVFSFTFLGGKCRYCHTKLSLQYPLAELLTGVFFVATYYYILSTGLLAVSPVPLVYYLFLISILLVVFFSDLNYGIIPNNAVYPAIIISLLYRVFFAQQLLLSYVLAGLFAGLFFFILFSLSRGRAMGFGDVKFAFLMGVILGPIGVGIALYLGFLTGGIVSFILLLCRRKTLKSTIPFGPFLVIGTLLVLFFQEIFQNMLRAVLPL